MNNNISYSAAVYLRLSKEDADMSGSMDKIESESIANQKALIFKYLESMPDVHVHDIYVDDGFSGTQFTSRPDFIRMQEDIYNEKINMVIVKDLSRFGRDHVDADRFIQKVFPALGVRFVAVVDHYDSLTATHSDRNLVVPFKNFINDNYSRDTGNKIRSSQEALRNTGKYIGAYVSYGYVKSNTEKGKILVDDYAAEIVRKIFSMKMNGKSAGAIAIRLNELGILAPSEYKKTLGINYKSGFKTKTTVLWSAVTVKRILTNRIYTGVLEQGKRSRISYKVRKVIERPQDEWAVVENNHEAIISSSDFEVVQKLLAADTRISPSESSAYLFSGILYCGDCGKGMTRRKVGEKITYICSSYNKGKECSRHTVAETDLQENVLKALQMHIELLAQMDEVLNHIDMNSIDYESVIANDGEISVKYQELERISRLTTKLYTDRLAGIISEEEFLQFKAAYEEKSELIAKSIENMKTSMKNIFANGIKTGEWMQHFLKYRNLEELDRIALVTMVDRIEVFEDKRMEITFSYADEYVTLTRFLDKLSDSEEMPLEDLSERVV